ncbi:MAG: DUF423 domain-containing protein [Sphingopyxis sp.]
MIEPERRGLVLASALSAALAIATAAFGAHGAGNEQAANWLRTGGTYQLIHAVAAIALMQLAPRAAWVMLIGAGLFAGTLYAMALGAPHWLGAITPIGGLLMIGAWLAVAMAALRAR